MFQRKKLPPIKSLIAQGTEISGDICFAEGLRIDQDGYIQEADAHFHNVGVRRDIRWSEG